MKGDEAAGYAEGGEYMYSKLKVNNNSIIILCEHGVAYSLELYFKPHMSTRNLSGGKGRPDHKAGNHTGIYETIF
jgi:hypothetical protein